MFENAVALVKWSDPAGYDGCIQSKALIRTAHNGPQNRGIPRQILLRMHGHGAADCRHLSRDRKSADLHRASDPGSIPGWSGAVTLVSAS